VNESHIDDDAKPLCESAVRTPDARVADDDSPTLDAAAVVNPVPPFSSMSVKQAVVVTA
jgi:hypothetical protein